MKKPKLHNRDNLRIHPISMCRGETCAIHNPSDHGMKKWDMNLRESGLVERLCPHGIGHPDPDSVAYLKTMSSEGDADHFGVHGCDGCCSKARR